MKNENQHLTITEEETRKEKRALWHMIGMMCFAVAFALLTFYKTTDNNLYLYPAAALAVLGAVLVEKIKKNPELYAPREK
ncbi:MAG: hypothetical protein IJ297_02250 [Clostridia bacterium]|nr:hypothetical protein [Clostridia bacterium]